MMHLPIIYCGSKRTVAIRIRGVWKCGRCWKPVQRLMAFKTPRVAS